MGSALWAGISGLNASSKELDVIANNLANVDTIGFKAGTTFFADVLSQSIAGGSSGTMQVGRGVAVAEVQTQFGAGSFETTGNSTDVAIDGDGFFMVNDNAGATYYTRAGSFHLDSNSLLVDTNGYKVQGQVVVNNVPVGALTDINLQNVQSAPAVTTTFALGANLNSQTVTGGQYNTTQTVYDSLGVEHTLNNTFTKTAATGMWGVQSSLDSTPATIMTANGFIFDGNGTLTNMYTGISSAVSAFVNAPAAVVVASGAGDTAVATLDHPGDVTAATTAPGFVLTRGATATNWTLAANAAYPNAHVVSADANTINIDLDGTTATDLHLTLAGANWANADTITVPLTHTADAATATIALDRPGMIYQTGTLSVTRGTTGWSIEDDGGYSNAQVTSTGTAGPVTISLDGTGTTDVTLNLTSAWAAGTTATFTLTNNSAIPIGDITDTFTGALPPGVTIGAGGSNALNWNLLGPNSLSLTQYGTASVTQSITSDGYSSGQLKTLSISANGRISGFFTNGQTTDLAQISLASFPDPWGLKKMGSNLFAHTIDSGSAVINIPGVSGMGSLTPNSLEMSNTDIATEFTNMITAQKAYQSSAKVITTQDAIMQELMNMIT
jgi:flagellar hook protein FlgE